MDNKDLFINDLYLFYRYFIASDYQNSVPAPHIKTLAHELMKLMVTDEYHRLAVSMPPRHNAEDNTPILTHNRGWTTHGDLKVGDYVYDLNAKPTKIIGVSEKAYCDQKITFTNNETIIVNKTHLWTVIDKDTGETLTLTTDLIRHNIKQYILPQRNRLETLEDNDYSTDIIGFKEIKTITKEEGAGTGHCIKIESTDGIYLIGEKLIPTHNSKSSMVTLAFPLWLIFQNPNRNILIVTTGGLTEKFGIKIREYVREYGEHFNCYLSDVKQASTYIMFCDKNGKLYKGSIRLTGMGGSVTGQDADVIILDDPYKGLDEEFTPTALQRKIDYAERVLEQRIEPHTRYCVLHTRWHSQDLIGHYRETQPHLFKFINFSAIQENGEPLWKEKYTITELLTKKQNMGERMFSAIYQQIPLDMTSDFFKMENIKHQGLDEDETIVRTVRSWDIAGADNMKGDYTCGALLSLTNKDNILLHNIVHGKFGQDTSNIIRNTAVKDGKDVTVLLETGVAGAGYLLFQSWKEQLKGFRVEQCKPVKSKVDRATPLRNLVFDGCLKLDFPLGDGKKRVLLDEFSSFPNGEHDDIVDAVAWGVNWLKFEYGGQRSVKPGLVRIRR